MKRIIFNENAFEDYNNWAFLNLKVFKRITGLIQEIKREPYKGTGKPEALRYDKRGYWSRRINKEHRLVYKVVNNQVLIASCKGHYID